MEKSCVAINAVLRYRYPLEKAVSAMNIRRETHHVMMSLRHGYAMR
jgi:hypothetical protein